MSGYSVPAAGSTRSQYPPPVPPSRRARHGTSAATLAPSRPYTDREPALSVATDAKTLYDLPPGLKSAGTARTNSARPRPGGFAAAAWTAPVSRATRPAASRRGSMDAGLRLHDARRQSDQTVPTLSALRAGALSPGSAREGSVLGSRLNPPMEPSMEDLRIFAQHCRQFYFSTEPPTTSADYITVTLASLPPSHRAAYTRLQSSFRSMAHLHHLRIRITSFHALIASTSVSGSLIPQARSDLRGSQAQGERRERLRKFIKTWCTGQAGGVEPFFRGLYSALRLQSRGDASRGGGGSHRVVWEIDDAVFMEAGGPEFMNEAIQVLKGILGFADEPLTAPPKLRRIRTLPRAYSNRSRRPSAGQIPSRAPSPLKRSTRQAAQTEELLDVQASNRALASSPVEIPASPSDPFIDTAGGFLAASPGPPRRASSPSTHHPLLSRENSNQLQPSPDRMQSSTARVLQAAADRIASSSGEGTRPRALRSMSDLSTSSQQPLIDPPPSSASALLVEDGEESDDLDEDGIAREEADLNRPRLRLWTFPAHITDPEAEVLMALFPREITRSRKGRSADVRFPFVRPGHGAKDLESTGSTWETVAVSENLVLRRPKEEGESSKGVVRSGTGRMWTGQLGREAGWEGSGWYRFKRWWRRLFGMA